MLGTVDSDILGSLGYEILVGVEDDIIDEPPLGVQPKTPHSKE